jgi:hypothetical protein
MWYQWKEFRGHTDRKKHACDKNIRVFPYLCKQKTLLRRADAQVILVAAENFENGVGRSPGQQLI